MLLVDGQLIHIFHCLILGENDKEDEYYEAPTFTVIII